MYCGTGWIISVLWQKEEIRHGTKGLGIFGTEILNFCVRFVMERNSGRKRRNLGNYSTKGSGQRGLGIP